MTEIETLDPMLRLRHPTPVRVIFDLDSTLSDDSERAAEFLQDATGCQREKPQWDEYFAACSRDAPITATIELAQGLMRLGYQLWILTGRTELVRQETMDWLRENGVPYHKLIMRPSTGKMKYAKNNGLKAYWLKQYEFTPENTRWIFDDNLRAVRMFREKGFTAYAVGDNEY